MKIKLVLIALVLLQFSFLEGNFGQKCSAEATADSEGKSVATADNAKVYKGKVQTMKLELEALEALGPYLKQVIKGANNLFETVTFQPVTLITQPTMVGPNSGTITNIPVGVQPTGPPKQLTPRELQTAINKMKPTIDHLKQNVDEFMSEERQLNIPPDLMTRLDPQFTEWVGLVNRISAQQIELIRISQNPPYDNMQIAKAALIIEKNAKRLEKVRSSLYKTMRKESKRLSS